MFDTSKTAQKIKEARIARNGHKNSYEAGSVFGTEVLRRAVESL